MALRPVDPESIKFGDRFRQGSTLYQVTGHAFGSYTEGDRKGEPWHCVILTNTERPSSQLRVLVEVLRERYEPADG